MVKLGTDSPRGFLVDAVGPRDDQRVANAASVSVLLVALAGGVTHLGPPPRVVGVRRPGSDGVQPVHRLVEGLIDSVEVPERVQHPVCSTLLGRPVVAEGHNHGVVANTQLVQRVQQSP